MSSIPRAHAIGVAVLCLLLGAVAIPAFARGSGSHAANRAVLKAPAEIAPDEPIKAAPATPVNLAAVPLTERGDTSTGASGRLRIHLLAAGSAPSGVYAIPDGVGGHPFAFIGLVPFAAKRGEYVDDYRVGFWPAEIHAVQSEAYENPAGFVEVTAENANTPVSDHFTLGDFVTHDRAPFP